MTPEQQKYFNMGLQAAAFIAQERAGDKNSQYSNDIMKFRMTEQLRLEQSGNNG